MRDNEEPVDERASRRREQVKAAVLRHRARKRGEVVPKLRPGRPARKSAPPAPHLPIALPDDLSGFRVLLVAASGPAAVWRVDGADSSVCIAPTQTPEQSRDFVGRVVGAGAAIGVDRDAQHLRGALSLFLLAAALHKEKLARWMLQIIGVKMLPSDCIDSERGVVVLPPVLEEYGGQILTEARLSLAAIAETDISSFSEDWSRLLHQTGRAVAVGAGSKGELLAELRERLLANEDEAAMTVLLAEVAMAAPLFLPQARQALTGRDPAAIGGFLDQMLPLLAAKDREAIGQEEDAPTRKERLG